MTEPFAALAFKIATDPFVGNLTFFRVYSGVLNSGDSVYNPVKRKKERVGRILQMHANSREEIKEVRAGDIAAAVDSTSGAVRSMLATLQRKGLVVRYRPPAGCGTACRQCTQGDIELYCLADAEKNLPHTGDCAAGD